MSIPLLPLFDTRRAAHAEVGPRKQQTRNRIMALAVQRRRFGIGSIDRDFQSRSGRMAGHVCRPGPGTERHRSLHQQRL